MSKLFRMAMVVAVCAGFAPPAVLGQDSGGSEAVAPAEQTEPSQSVWKKMFGGTKPAEAAPEGESPESGVEGSYTYSSKVRQAQAKLHKTQAMEMPEVREYINMVDARQAGPAQLEAFSHLLARNGFLEIGFVYSGEAVRLDRDNPRYWTNHGTIARFMGDHSKAIDAYRTALKIDPGLAMAHYNLGVSYDATGKYDQAIEEYVKAFTIDPSLAEVSVNPQVVNNYSLAAASLLLYTRSGGIKALPLIPVGEMDPGELTLEDDTFD
jgi:tetratricopeptide (TPR) repeat protein